MPETPSFPSIPVPTEDPKALLETCITMKRILEMLTGQDMGQTFAPHVFVQAEEPVPLHVGDLWLCTGTVSSFNVWSGSGWAQVATVAMTMQGDLLLSQFSRRKHR